MGIIVWELEIEGGLMEGWKLPIQRKRNASRHGMTFLAAQAVLTHPRAPLRDAAGPDLPLGIWFSLNRG